MKQAGCIQQAFSRCPKLNVVVCTYKAVVVKEKVPQRVRVHVLVVACIQEVIAQQLSNSYALLLCCSSPDCFLAYMTERTLHNNTCRCRNYCGKSTHCRQSCRHNCRSKREPHTEQQNFLYAISDNSAQACRCQITHAVTKVLLIPSPQH
jgi:hypothetical protein